MKKLILILALLSGSAFASGFQCPTSIEGNAKAKKAFSFIKPFEGSFQMGSCKVEIQICDQALVDEEGISSFAADMLIIDSAGFERYVPFFVTGEKQTWSKDVLLLTERAFVYRFKDRNYDPQTGKFERWDVEIVKSPDLKKIDYIELGYSSENEQKAEIGKNWIICGTEREEEVLKHPVRHKFKSWWWWITHPGTR